MFRYPGIRSDSDLHTFGFPFRPWTEPRAIADGPSIKKYMQETASIYGIDKHIKYHHKLITANWSSDAQSWSLTVETAGETRYFHSKFLLLATGYYNYDEALPAKIPGIENFQGTTIHPQFWPEDLDYAGKNVVIIGSGATAVTLLPNLAKEAAHVTMLQRSPSYILSLPQQDSISYWARRLLPKTWAYKLIRTRFLVLPFLFFKFCRSFPNAARTLLQKGAAKQLPIDYSIKPNFDPKYDPWEQRLCISPNGDFYKAIADGNAEVVTAHIKQVTEKSIHLEETDRVITPDIIITATGLKLQIAGGAKISVDNEQIKIPEKHLWKGCMLQDVPNAAVVIGYTNASWTLGSDATAQFITRLLNYNKKHGFTSAVPRLEDPDSVKEVQVLNLNSTYVVRAKGDLPKAGDKAPWLPRSTYFTDLFEAKFGSITSGMQFSRVST